VTRRSVGQRRSLTVDARGMLLLLAAAVVVVKRDARDDTRNGEPTQARERLSVNNRTSII